MAKINIAFPFDEVAGNTAEEYFGLDERYEITGAIYTDKDGVTQHAANYVTFSVQNAGATKTYYTYSTQTAAQGTITALTPTSLINGADADDAIVDAGTGLRVHAAPSGAGKALDGTIVVSLVTARKFS